jgi:hypothetical protein
MSEPEADAGNSGLNTEAFELRLAEIRSFASSVFVTDFPALTQLLISLSHDVTSSFRTTEQFLSSKAVHPDEADAWEGNEYPEAKLILHVDERGSLLVLIFRPIVAEYLGRITHPAALVGEFRQFTEVVSAVRFLASDPGKKPLLQVYSGLLQVIFDAIGEMMSEATIPFEIDAINAIVIERNADAIITGVDFPIAIPPSYLRPMSLLSASNGFALDLRMSDQGGRDLTTFLCTKALTGQEPETIAAIYRQNRRFGSSPEAAAVLKSVKAFDPYFSNSDLLSFSRRVSDIFARFGVSVSEKMMAAPGFRPSLGSLVPLESHLPLKAGVIYVEPVPSPKVADSPGMLAADSSDGDLLALMENNLSPYDLTKGLLTEAEADLLEEAIDRIRWARDGIRDDRPWEIDETIEKRRNFLLMRGADPDDYDLDTMRFEPHKEELEEFQAGDIEDFMAILRALIRRNGSRPIGSKRPATNRRHFDNLKRRFRLEMEFGADQSARLRTR